jgi:putative phage-type endonuclease
MNKAQVKGIVPGTPEWLEIRKKHLGASETPKALGYSRYGDGRSVCLDKWGEAPPVEMTPQMRRGLILERPVMLAYALQTGATIQDSFFAVHPDHAELSATPDGVRENGSRINVQVKTHSSWIADEYGESGSDEFPDAERIQVTQEMAVIDADASDLVVLFADEDAFGLLQFMLERGAPNSTAPQVARYILDNMDLRVFPVARDRALENDIVQAGVEFWNDHVVAHKLPPDIMKMQDSGAIRPATEEEAIMVSEYKERWLNKKRADNAMIDPKRYLIYAILGSAGIDSDAGKITFKKSKDRNKDVTNWEQVALALSDNLLDGDWNKLVEEHTYTIKTKGTRRFCVPNRKWGKDV